MQEAARSHGLSLLPLLLPTSLEWVSQRLGCFVSLPQAQSQAWVELIGVPVHSVM